MYCKHFGFRCLPFEDRPDSQFFYATGDRVEALAAVEYEVQFGKGMALVLGQAGIGKTLLTRAMIRRMEPTDKIVVLKWMANNDADLIREVAKGYGVSLPSSSQAKSRCITRLKRHLLRNLNAQHRSVLFIDQAEHLSTEHFEQLETIADLTDAGRRLLKIVLVGQQRVETRLKDPKLARISQQLYGNRTILPLNRADTLEYVAHRLKVAGAGEGEIFDEDAITLIHEASRGVPRIINHMCNAALLAAYGGGETSITRAIVEESIGGGESTVKTADAAQVGVPAPDKFVPGLRSPARPAAPSKESITADPTAAPMRYRAAGPRPASGAPAPVSHGRQTAGDLQGALATGVMDMATTEIEPSEATPFWDSDPDEFSASSPFASEEGAVLLERLERTLARAERSAATSEASISRVAAFEKQLNTLVDVAERTAGRLGSAVRQGETSVASLEQRSGGAAQVLESRLESIEANLARVTGLSCDAEERAERIEQACVRADRTETHLTSFVERLVDQAEDVRSRITTLVSGAERSEEARARLAGVVESVTTVERQAGQQVASMREMLDKGKSEFETLTQQLAQSSRGRLEEISQDAKNEVERLRDTIAQGKREEDRSFSLQVQQAREELDELQRKTAIEISRRFEQRMLETLEESKRSGAKHAEEIGSALDQSVNDARPVVESAQRATAKLEGLCASNAEATEQAGRLTESLHSALETSKKEADTLVDRATRTVRGEIEQLKRESSQELLRSFEEKMRLTLADSIRRGIQESEKVKNTLEESVKTVRPIMDSAQRTMDRMGSIVEEGKTQLVRSVDQLAKKTMERFERETQERSLHNLRLQEETLRNELSKCESKLESIVEESTTHLRKVEVGAAACTEKLDESLAQAKQSQIQLLTGVAARVNRLGEQIEELDKRQGGVELSYTALAEEIEVKAVVAAELVESVDRIGPTVAELHARAEAAQSELRPATKEAEKVLASVHGACGQVETLQRSVTNTLVDLGGACERAAAVRTLLTGAESVAEKLDTRKIDAEETIERLAVAGFGIKTMLDKADLAVKETNEQQDRTHSQTLAAKKAMEELATKRDEVSNAVDRAQEATDAIACCTEVADQQGNRLSCLLAEGNQASIHLKELISSKNDAEDTVEQLAVAGVRLRTMLDQATATVQESNDQQDRVRTQTAAAATAVDELVAKREELTELVDRAQEATDTITSCTEVSKRQGNRLADLLAEENQASSHLQELLSSAQQLNEAMQGAVSHVDEKVGCLDSHNAAASSVLRSLTQANVEGQALVERVTRSAEDFDRSATESTDRIKRLIDESRNQASLAQNEIESLRVCNQEIVDLLARVPSVESVRQQVDDLVRNVESAKRQESEIAERCELASELTERLGAVSQALRGAREMEVAVRESVEHAQSVQDGLLQASEVSAQRIEELDALSASAIEAIDRCSNVKKEAAAVVGLLDSRKLAAQKTIDAGQGVLNGFLSKARKLEERVQECASKVLRVDEGVKKLIARPAELVHQAQSHAAELERVCQVVEKVFSKLSRASLEARDLTVECRSTGEEAGERLNRLSGETDRVATTLQQWVGEAVRVQSRLATTLQKCPSIHETHPGEELQRFAKSVGEVGRIANNSASAPSVPIAAQSIQATISGQSGEPIQRADEIERMIQDAKRATAKR